MPGRLFVILAVALMCAAPISSAVADGGHTRPRELQPSSCTTVKVAERPYVLYRHGVSCSVAKRLVRRLAETSGRSRPAGFSCTSGSKFRRGGYCQRGGKHFGWDAGHSVRRK